MSVHLRATVTGAPLCCFVCSPLTPFLVSFFLSFFCLFVRVAPVSVGIVALVMLLLTIGLTMVLLKKLRYLSREDGNVYGQLQPSGATDSAAGTI